ncbi:MAG: 2Fe-2S iron-sulfur cluster-binding protein, partial [Bacteroidales bacterium]|nr:2Fe-2S iron-sulfur cluster-binding protein [Bacteroidales bacterium]
MILGISLAGTVLMSMIVFMIVMILLVVVLLYARQKLTPQGDVTLKINDRELIVSPGSSVLSTLSGTEIFLPSACGGGGTCGMCKCQVIEGGGAILPTETGFFTRREQHEQWRLGCQVKVREDMTIHVPEAVLGIRKWE